jgi:PAS domain S-box-containing protein
LGHHFAGNGNPFWRLLFASGLVPEPIGFADADLLATHGIALTNLCPRTTRTAAELTADEIDRGRRTLARKIARWRPAVVAFVGVSLYQMFYRLSASGGPGEKPERLGSTRVFVVPNPSGLNASFPGFEHKLVWFKALREFVPDVVLSDFSMPGFSGQAALAIVSEHAPDTPLVFVSGAVGEELAIEALKRGAADYVLKDNLRRLPSAVWRALQLKRDRIERRHIERALMESEDRFRNIVENSQDWIWEIDLQGRQTYCNPSVHRILGYSPDEMEGEDSLQYLHPEDVGEVRRRLPDLINRREGWRRWRLRWLHREGGVRILESTAIPIVDAGGELAGYRGIDHDVTEFEVQQARIRHLGRLHAV